MVSTPVTRVTSNVVPRPGSLSTEKGLGRVTLWERPTPVLFPTYFPAVSSTSTNWRAIYLVRYLTESRYPRMLVSAYDLRREPRSERRQLWSLVRKFMRQGGVLMLDSGAFEAYWRRDLSWSLDVYEGVTRELEPDLASSFDPYLPSQGGKNRLPTQRVENTVGSQRRSPGLITAVHSSSPRGLPAKVKKILDGSASALAVGIPERECGTTLLARIQTIARVRATLDRVSPGTGIHVFGCGNPVAMAFYSYSGASSFDSQDWSEGFIDPKSLLTLDYSVASTLACNCGACKKIGDGTYDASLAHNLLFYQGHSRLLQRMIVERTLWDYLIVRSSRAFVDRVVRVLKGAARGS